MSHNDFAALVDIIAAPWTSNNFHNYNSQFSKLKTNQEKVSSLLLSILFQIPKVSIKASSFFSEKCKIPLSDIPELLPQPIFESLFCLLPSLAVRKNATYSRVIVTLATSLPLSSIHSFLEVLLKFPTIHQLKTIYSILIQRDNSLSDYFFDNYIKFEKALSSCLFLQSFSDEFILKIASLFLSGKVSPLNNLFYSFCYYINKYLFPITVESTDIFLLSLFQKIELHFSPKSHYLLFNMIIQSLDEFPLPFMTIHMFYQNFNSNQQKSILISLITAQSSIKSYFVISQVINSSKMKEIYSISICARFLLYEPTKKTINFFKKSFEKITHLRFELRVLTKVLEIASKAAFTKISLAFLEILKKFTPTASVLKMILLIFLSKETKSISELVNQNLVSLLTSFYLLSNSPLVTSQLAKKKFILLIKTVIPLIDLKKIESNCSTTKTISNLISQSNLTADTVIRFLTKFTVNQIKPQQFNKNSAIDLIRSFSLDDSELGYEIQPIEVPLQETTKSDHLINTQTITETKLCKQSRNIKLDEKNLIQSKNITENNLSKEIKSQNIKSDENNLIQSKNITHNNISNETQSKIDVNLTKNNDDIIKIEHKEEIGLKNETSIKKDEIKVEQKEKNDKIEQKTETTIQNIEKKAEIKSKNEKTVSKQEITSEKPSKIKNSNETRKIEKEPPRSPKSLLNEPDIDDFMLSVDGFDLAMPDDSDLSYSSKSSNYASGEENDFEICDEETVRLFANLLLSSDDED